MTPEGRLHVEVVPAALDGQRIDRVVAMVVDRSRAVAADLVAAGAVRVEGDPVTKPSTRVAAGQRVEVEAPEPPELRPRPDPGVEVAVVHADPDVVVVDKPAGLVVHPGAGHEEGTLVHGLVARFPELAGVGQPDRPGIVHRLDRGTSGLLLVARSARAYDGLVSQLAARTVERRYVALVADHLDTPSGVIDAPIGRSRRDPTRMAVTASGKPARTHYEVRRTFTDPIACTLLECRLETGRTHQIRVHLAAIGHPVVGDERYHGARSGLPLARPFLHAAMVGFTHPVTGEHLRFTSPLPPDLAAVLEALG